MNISISFKEIKDIISKKTNNKINLDFTRVCANTVKVSYKPMAFMPTVNVNVQVRVSDSYRIVLSYDTNPAVDMMIKALASYLDSNIPKEIVVLDTVCHFVVIYLDKIEQLQKPLEMTELKLIYFEEENVCAEIILKSN